MASSGSRAVRPASREIARAAVRTELGLAAYDLVVEKGYGNVTLDGMAAAGGVSRSTFVRYFPTKDEVIQVALEAHVERMADALRARPPEEDDWSALRHAIESFIVPIYTRHPAGAQAFTRLVLFTRGLATVRLEQQDWRTPLTRALAERHGGSEHRASEHGAGEHGAGEPFPIGLAVKVAAALDCMGLAVSYWAAADGQADLTGLLRDCFRVLSGEGDQPGPPPAR